MKPLLLILLLFASFTYADTTVKVTESITLERAKELGLFFSESGETKKFNFSNFTECTVESVTLQTFDNNGRILMSAEIVNKDNWYEIRVYDNQSIKWELVLDCKFGGRGIYMMYFISPYENIRSR